jgi:hypothetical protein
MFWVNLAKEVSSLVKILLNNSLFHQVVPNRRKSLIYTGNIYKLKILKEVRCPEFYKFITR